MSKRQFRIALIEELDRINDSIDRKIVRGLPYHSEAKRHKRLLARLRAADRQWPSLRKVGTFKPLALFLT